MDHFRAPARAVYTAVISNNYTFLREHCEIQPRTSWVIRLLAGTLHVKNEVCFMLDKAFLLFWTPPVLPPYAPTITEKL